MKRKAKGRGAGRRGVRCGTRLSICVEGSSGARAEIALRMRASSGLGEGSAGYEGSLGPDCLEAVRTCALAVRTVEGSGSALPNPQPDCEGAAALARRIASAAYSGDRARVFSTAVAAVRELFPDLAEDDARAVVAIALAEVEGEDPLSSAAAFAAGIADAIEAKGKEREKALEALVRQRFPDLSDEDVEGCTARLQLGDS